MQDLERHLQQAEQACQASQGTVDGLSSCLQATVTSVCEAGEKCARLKSCVDGCMSRLANYELRVGVVTRRVASLRGTSICILYLYMYRIRFCVCVCVCTCACACACIDNVHVYMSHSHNLILSPAMLSNQLLLRGAGSSEGCPQICDVTTQTELPERTQELTKCVDDSCMQLIVIEWLMAVCLAGTFILYGQKLLHTTLSWWGQAS